MIGGLVGVSGLFCRFTEKFREDGEDIQNDTLCDFTLSS